jgi:threonine aldolase
MGFTKVNCLFFLFSQRRKDIHMRAKYYFASDNSAPVCPEAWEALTRANVDAIGSYGNDTITQEAKSKIRDFFERDCEVFFVFNGTAANALLVASMCDRFETVLSHQHAHIETDECSAPEFFGAGTKVKGIPGDAGKIDIESLKKRLEFPKAVHFSPAAALSVSQPSELGRVYSPAEMRELGEICRHSDIWLHVDGARLTNAIVAAGCSPAELTWKAGVDAISFGGTKQGLGFSEAVVIFDPELAQGFAYRQKQGGQLASKMRFLSAPWTVFMQDGVWNRHAENANQMIRELVEMLSQFGFKPVWPVEANAAFYRLPPGLHQSLETLGWQIYPFVEDTIRFMTSWNSRPEQIAELKADIERLLSKR